MAATTNASVLRFGVFELDPARGDLRRSGRIVKLQPQPLRVLYLLASHPNQLVTREELQQQIWNDGTFVDFEHALNFCISQMRAALGDDAETPRYIETVPRRGYRFIAPVETVSHIARDVPPRNATSAERHVLRNPRVWAALLAVASICSLAGGIAIGRRTSRYLSPVFHRMTFQHGTVLSARFSPDGQSVVYSAWWEGRPIELFVSPAATPQARSLELKQAYILAVSRQNELALALNGTLTAHLVFTNATLARAPFGGSAPRQVLNDVRWADWDGNGNLAVVRNVEGESRLEFPVGKVLYAASGWISHIRFSPQSSLIAFLEHPYWSEDRGEVAVVDLSGKKKVLSAGWASEQGLAWSPAGDEVWFTAAASGYHRDLFGVTLSGKRRSILQSAEAFTLQDISSDGRVLLTVEHERYGTRSVTPHQGKGQELSWYENTCAVDISADGNQVLLDEQGEQAGANYIVAVRSLQGSQPVKLGEGRAGGLSPDGKWVAATVPEGSGQIRLFPSGAGQAKETSAQQVAPGSMQLVRFLVDGKHLLFTGAQHGHLLRTYVTDLTGSMPTPITPDGAIAFVPSPDGEHIAGLDSKQRVAVFSTRGEAARQIPGDLEGFRPIRWSRNGRFLYVYRRTEVPARVYQVDPSNGHKQLVMELAPDDPTGIVDMDPLVMTPDAKVFVYTFDQILSQLYIVEGLR